MAHDDAVREANRSKAASKDELLGSTARCC